MGNAVIEGKQGESFEPVMEENVEEVEKVEPTSIEEVVAEEEPAQE